MPVDCLRHFSSLWDAEPGSGLINLQLARLAAAKNKSTEAVNFYRASIYGTWEGDGVVRRRDVRFELTRYLLQHGDSAAARAELLVIEGNAGSDPVLDLEIGNLFHQAGDISAALEAYMKASEADPKDPAPLAAAGQLAYSIEDGSRPHSTCYSRPCVRKKPQGSSKSRVGRADRYSQKIRPHS